MKSVLKTFVRLYKILVSPLLGRSCRFHPTCSSYALEALERHGPAKGVWLLLRRIACCHPWSRKAMRDPVPERFDWPMPFRYKR